MTSRRAVGLWLAAVLTVACVDDTRVTAPMQPAPGRPAAAPGDVLGPFPIPTPNSNMEVVPASFISTGLTLLPGAAYRVVVTGTLTFTENSGYASCPNTPPPPTLPGGNVVGPQGMAAGNHPYGVVIGIGTASQPPGSALNIHVDDASSIHTFAGGPGVLWVERPVYIPGAVEGPNCPFSPAYDVTSGGQPITAEELPPATIDPDRTHVRVGDTVQAQLTVPWTSNFFLLQGWAWVPEDASGGSATRFLSGCSRFVTFCSLEVHERGHLRIDDIVAEGQVFLTALSPVIEVATQDSTLHLELTVTPTEFEPVMTQCFYAMSQVSLNPDRDPPAHVDGCDPINAGRTPAPRSDHASVRVRAFWQPSGNPAKNATVMLRGSAVDSSGGHVHLADRPRGTFFKEGEDPSDPTGTVGARGETSVTLSDAGEFTLTFRPSGVSGTEKVLGSVGVAGKEAKDSTEVHTALGGLVELQDGGNVDTIGVVAGRHPDSHWGEPTMVNDLVVLANALASLRDRVLRVRPNVTYPESLGVNDISLPQGGLFDIDRGRGDDWSFPHRTHRDGRGADVNVQLDPSWNTYYRVLRTVWIDRLHHSIFDERTTGSPHIHLNLPPERRR